jgi:hypothetical protein
MQISAGLISSFSIIPVLIAVLIKFHFSRVFRPFFYLIIIGSAIELSNVVSGYFHNNTLWLINIFVLVQFYLIMYQFYTWKLVTVTSFVNISAVAIVTALWIAESLHNSLYRDLNNYSLAFSSFFIALFATVYINRLIFEKIDFLLKDPRFLISVGFLIYFTTNVIVFIFTRNEGISGALFTKLWTVHDFINIFTNIIYTVGVLCLSRK